MIPLQIALTALCLLSALYLLVLIVRDRRPDRLVLNALLVAEAGLLVNLVLAIVRVAQGVPENVSWPEYIGYAVGVMLLIPAGVFWSAGERSRGGTAVVLAAALIVPFMFLRLAQVWPAGG